MREIVVHAGVRPSLRARRQILCFALIVAAAMAFPSKAAASCPVTATALTLAGKGAAGREDIYRFDVLFSKPGFSELQLVVAKGTQRTTVSWKPAFDASVPFPQTMSYWIVDSPRTPVTAVSIASVTDDMTDVSCAPVRLTPSGDRTIVVFDDAYPHATIETAAPPRAAMIENSDFITQLQPNYPVSARNKGAVGTVDVEVQIGPDGALQDSWVRWAAESDGADLLSGPALDAARKSKFKAATIDGHPVIKRYEILYSFMIDDLDKPVQLPPDDEFGLCPLAIDRITTAPPSSGDPNAWYFLSATASRADIVSAVIGVRDAQGNATGYPWPGPVLEPSSLRKRWTANATFNWSAAPMDQAWIDQVTLAGGKTYSCSKIVEKPEPATQPAAPRVHVGAPLPLLAVQSPVDPAFRAEVWPDYPVGADGKRAAGQATVESLVDDKGSVIDAFVTESSGRNELDLAAIEAAQASTYAPAPPHGLVDYRIVYRFIL